MLDTETLLTVGVSCDLCGLACGAHPYTQKVGHSEQRFCCMGCMNVYLILSESVGPEKNFRDTELFKRSLELGIIARPEEQNERESKHVVSFANTEEVSLHVRGMWCTSCAWLIEYALKKVDGVLDAEASFASDMVRVRFQPQRVPPPAILERVRSLGYRAQEFRPGDDEVEREKRDLLLRLGIAAFLWMNVMYLSMTLYVSFFEKIADGFRQYVPFIIWGLATPVVFYCGYPILRLAWLGLKNGTIRAEALLSLGILAAYLYSIRQAFRHDPHIYFDTACVIITLVLAGKLIESGAKQKASHWIALLHRMMPNKVRLLSDGRERFASVEALQPEQIFITKAGEQVPADGVVAEGDSECDESLLTGESKPVSKKAGDTVFAGSINLTGALKVSALRSIQESTLAKVVARVEHAVSERSPIERAVDRVARIFVPGVLVFAGLSFLGLWLISTASFGTALLRAITILVIACPCALGLATPLAITAAMGWASHRGILFRDSRVLETLREVDAVVLDKTGTVTEGSFALLHFVVHDEDVLKPNSSQALSRVASVERFSEHPLGRAVVEYANTQGAPVLNASSVQIIKGSGIVGIVQGVRVFIGNRRLAKDEGARLDHNLEVQAESWESEGKTVTFFGWGGELRGLMALGDRVRDSASSLVADLQRSGRSVYLISGDSPTTTRCVAQEIGATQYESDVAPEWKADLVRELQSRGLTVAMVGDGINDAPALAQADLGIAMGSGTDLAMKASAVVLMKNSLADIPQIFALSAKTIRVVRQNLFWAFFYNAIGMVLAVTGVLNPILAAGAMLLSSVSVVTNSLRHFSRRDPEPFTG